MKTWTWREGEAYYKRQSAKDIQELRRQLCVDAESFKERLFRAGLFLTAHSMDETTRQIGWEVAALEQGKKLQVQR